MTLLELLVCLAVVAILFGILLPAVQKVRSASQRTTCQNNLRQLGLATHNYEQAHGRIPRSACAGTPGQRFQCLSAQARLLPYLDEGPLAAAIDWNDDSPDYPWSVPLASNANRPLLKHRVVTFLCPADSFADGGALSYRQSNGWNLIAGGRDPLPSHLIAIKDGLSHTALYGERLVGADGAEPARNPLVVDCGDPQNIAPACIQAQMPPTDMAGDCYAGATWLRGGDRQSTYTHMFLPNSRLRDCEVAGWVGFGMMTARSAHPGGVNIQFADGHVVFVGDSVDLQVWRAWATPNGDEVNQ